MSQSIYINQDTQDLEVNSQGQLVDMNSLLTELYARLSTPIGTYRYDTTFGSLIPTYVQQRQVITINKINTAIVNSLTPMVTRGSIVNIQTVSYRIGIGGFSVVLSVTDSNANTFTFPYSVQG